MAQWSSLCELRVAGHPKMVLWGISHRIEAGSRAATRDCGATQAIVFVPLMQLSASFSNACVRKAN